MAKKRRSRQQQRGRQFSHRIDDAVKDITVDHGLEAAAKAWSQPTQIAAEDSTLLAPLPGRIRMELLSHTGGSTQTYFSAPERFFSAEHLGSVLGLLRSALTAPQLIPPDRQHPRHCAVPADPPQPPVVSQPGPDLAAVASMLDNTLYASEANAAPPTPGPPTPPPPPIQAAPEGAGQAAAAAWHGLSPLLNGDGTDMLGWRSTPVGVHQVSLGPLDPAELAVLSVAVPRVCVHRLLLTVPFSLSPAASTAAAVGLCLLLRALQSYPHLSELHVGLRADALELAQACDASRVARPWAKVLEALAGCVSRNCGLRTVHLRTPPGVLAAEGLAAVQSAMHTSSVACRSLLLMGWVAPGNASLGVLPQQVLHQVMELAAPLDRRLILSLHQGLPTAGTHW